MFLRFRGFGFLGVSGEAAEHPPSPADTLAILNLADFGQANFGQNWCFRKKDNKRKVGLPNPEKWGPEGWGPEGW